jgi:VanZ family protein
MVAARITAWLLALAILVLSVVPAEWRPATGIPHDIEHFGIFIATGFAFGLGYARRYATMAIVMLIFAAAIEALQLFVPGRYALLTDFFLNTLALFYGVAAATPSRPQTCAGRLTAQIPKQANPAAERSTGRAGLPGP